MSDGSQANKHGGKRQPLRVTLAVMADIKVCVQCGTSFAPRREHARFCSARCRVAWNRHNASAPPIETGALGWSITAMRETTGRLLRATDWDRANGFAVISEAVWWVTMVDATLMRYQPDIHSRVLAGQDPGQRRITEDTFGGLRFVRNRMGYDTDPADFIQPLDSRPGAGRIAAWTWRPVPRTRARIAHAARAGMGDDAIPGLPGPARRPAHRGDLQPGHRLPPPRRRRQQPQPHLAGPQLASRPAEESGKD